MIVCNEPLDSCPFCGEDAALFEDYRYPDYPGDAKLVYGVLCSNPDCIMHQQQKYYLTESSARKAWNRRKEKTSDT